MGRLVEADRKASQNAKDLMTLRQMATTAKEQIGSQSCHPGTGIHDYNGGRFTATGHLKYIKNLLVFLLKWPLCVCASPLLTLLQHIHPNKDETKDVS